MKCYLRKRLRRSQLVKVRSRIYDVLSPMSRHNPVYISRYLYDYYSAKSPSTTSIRWKYFFRQRSLENVWRVSKQSTQILFGNFSSVFFLFSIKYYDADFKINGNSKFSTDISLLLIDRKFRCSFFVYFIKISIDFNFNMTVRTRHSASCNNIMCRFFYSIISRWIIIILLFLFRFLTNLYFEGCDLGFLC